VSRFVSRVPRGLVSKSVSRYASDRGHQGTVYRPSQVRSIGRVNGLMVSRASVVHKSLRLLPALWRPGMTRQPRPSRVYPALPFSGRLVMTADGAWPPHNCPHSPWRGAHMGPAGHVSCVAGGGWGFEADLIPAHSPMLSRTRKTHPIPSHRFAGFLGDSVDRFGRRCASR